MDWNQHLRAPLQLRLRGHDTTLEVLALQQPDRRAPTQTAVQKRGFAASERSATRQSHMSPAAADRGLAAQLSCTLAFALHLPSKRIGALAQLKVHLYAGQKAYSEGRCPSGIAVGISGADLCDDDVPVETIAVDELTSDFQGPRQPSLEHFVQKPAASGELTGQSNNHREAIVAFDRFTVPTAVTSSIFESTNKPEIEV